MSIAALPASAVRLIGATQVLTDSCSLIKELLDNALDARATSISIELSLDTLSVLQARDNGHGVAPADRDLLCRRYCTSKIREYGDLKSVGGTTLGFRGEALASACEIAGEVGVTTRVEGEDVACALKMSQMGEVKSRTRASHPVGTTVKVTELFKHLPVRKQTAVKAAAKTLAKVKTMLQAYALARPNVRFALKVLKAKNDKGNWTYVPAKGQPKEDAAFKIVGKECAGQCEWQVLELHGFEVQAFMPRPDAVAGKISNIGHFVSVDDRPMGTVRGTLKQVMTMFKEKLRGCGKGLEGAKDPFIWLNLVCPLGSYDANVEPAKDDVVFENSNLVLEAVGALLSSYYVPAPRVEDPEELTSASSGLQEFDDDIEEPPRKRRRSTEPAQRDMYSGNDDDVNMLYENPIPTASIEEEGNSQDGLNDISIANPWTVAKMNSSTKTKLRRTGFARNGQLLTPLHERNDMEENSTSEAQDVPIPAHPLWQLMTPAASSPPKKVSHAREREESPLPFQAAPRRQHHEDDEETVQGMAENLESTEADGLFLPDEPSAQRWRGWSKTADFTSAARLPPGTPQPQPPTQNAFEAMLPTPNTLGRPFPAPRRRAKQRQSIAEDDYDDSSAPQAEDESRVWFDHLQDAASGSSPAARGSGRKQKTQKQRGRDDIDIRDLFGGGGSRVPIQSSTMPEEVVDVDAGKRLDVDMRAFTRKSRGGTVNAPFRPVVPQWRTNQAVRDQSVLDDHDEAYYDAQEQRDNDDLLDEDEDQSSLPASLHQQSQPPSTLNLSQLPNSSLAQLSTPRRFAACTDCHDPNSAPHNHNHDPPARPSTTTTTATKAGLKRTRSLAHLPLERTPATYHIQNLQTLLHNFTPDTLAILGRERKDWLKSGELLELEVGACVWGVLEPLRCGDVVVEEGNGEADGGGTAEGEGDPEREGWHTRHLQSAFTSPLVPAEEVQAWTQWLGSWIARSYAIPEDGITNGDSGKENEGEAGEETELGMYVADALSRHALMYAT